MLLCSIEEGNRLVNKNLEKNKNIIVSTNLELIEGIFTGRLKLV